MKRFGYLIALTSMCLSAVTAQGAESALVDGENVIVRAQPTRFSEVLTRLQPGAQVTVLERVTIEKTKPEDESEWSRVALPEGVSVWVHGAFIQDGKVNANRLNLRAGPGENFSVLGQLENGTAVETISVEGDWMEIVATAEASAYIASRLLKAGGEVPAVASEPDTATEVAEVTDSTEAGSEPLTETTVSDESIPEIEPTEVTTEPVTPSETEMAAAETGGTDVEPPFSVPAPEIIEEPPPKRIVMREGIVKGTVSIQAPTHYELVSPFTGKTINYLHTTSTNLVLDRYRGLRIIVTGEEGMDKRWTNTPVITIQRIQVVEE